MTNLLSNFQQISIGSVSIAGGIYIAFNKLDELASEDFKKTIFQWISGKKVSEDNEIADHSTNTKWLGEVSFVKNAMTTLILMLVILSLLLSFSALFGDEGIIKISQNKVGEASVSINKMAVQKKKNELSLSINEFISSPWVFVTLLSAFVQVILVLVPSYFSTRLTAYVFNTFLNINSIVSALVIFMIETLVKLVLVILYISLILSVGGYFLDSVEFHKVFLETTNDFLRIVTLQQGNNYVAVAAFYSILYASLLYLVVLFNILVSKTIILRKSLGGIVRLFDVKNKPFSVIGVPVSIVIFILSFITMSLLTT